jgi:hypothetical protein
MESAAPVHGVCAAAASFNKAWLASHLEACRTLLGNKPLVLQEYNMPQCPQRTEYYRHVSYLTA